MPSKMEIALFLGLTSGGACLATCGLLIASSLAAERITLKRSAALLTVFLSGRFLGYIGWAVLSWVLGKAIFQNPGGLALFTFAGLVLGGWLIYYGISRPSGHSPEICPAPHLKILASPIMPRQDYLRSGTWGILSGFQVCPPFLAAVTEAARTGSLGGSLLFFLVFYLGTGLWFVPFPFIGTLGRFRQVAQVARFCAVPLGAYYIYSGLVHMAGGNLFNG
jgi:sulfite exporter TauE/SafE